MHRDYNGYMANAATIKCDSRKLLFFFKCSDSVLWNVGIAFSGKIISLPHQTLVVQNRKRREEKKTCMR